MAKKFFSKQTAGVFLALALLSAGSWAETEETEQRAAAEPPTAYVTDDLMARADMWGSCDDTALAAVMRKAEKKEPVTIACIGGSITQGTISNGTSDQEVGFRKCYADLFFAWWEQTFPDTEFTFINAGIGATGSYIGVHRVQRDVLNYTPDLVLVEFSVNDQSSTTDKITYDNLVYRILTADCSPAALLLFMGQTNGATAQDVHSLVGFRYKLPMLSYANVIDDMMAQQIFRDKQLSGDTTHPSALGHAIAGEILWRYLNGVYEQADTYGEPEPFDEPSLTTDIYQNADILDNQTLTLQESGTFEAGSAFPAFPDGWTCAEGDGGLTFTVTCSRLGFLYLRTTDGKSGQFDVFVDGERTATLDGNFAGGWGNYAEAAEVFASRETQEHTVVISRSPDSQQEGFAVLGVLISG